MDFNSPAKSPNNDYYHVEVDNLDDSQYHCDMEVGEIIL